VDIPFTPTEIVEQPLRDPEVPQPTDRHVGDDVLPELPPTQVPQHQSEVVTPPQTHLRILMEKAPRFADHRGRNYQAHCWIPKHGTLAVLQYVVTSRTYLSSIIWRQYWTCWQLRSLANTAGEEINSILISEAYHFGCLGQQGGRAEHWMLYLLAMWNTTLCTGTVGPIYRCCIFVG